MSLLTISPAQARRLIEEGALLIDIRRADEHARERIPGALNSPVDSLTAVEGKHRPVIFHCIRPSDADIRGEACGRIRLPGTRA